jgi:hypothetical protein
MDMWPVILDGGTSPRTSLVYNVDQTSGTVREGDMKLVWTAAFPPVVELFDLAADPGETTNLAEQMPEVVARLQAEVLRLGREMAMPLLFPEMIAITYSQPPVFAGR